MLKHAERRLLQLAGCRALRKVVTNSDDECIRAVKAEPGLVKAVQAALKVSLCCANRKHFAQAILTRCMP